MFGFKVFKVEGNSMEECIPDKSFVFLCPFFSFNKKSIYLFKHNIYGIVIKKLKYEDFNGDLWFEGENYTSISSIKIGAIKKKQVIGKAFLNISKLGVKWL